MKGTEFKELREQMGYKTRRSIADEIGVSFETVKSWERNVRPVPKYARLALARIAVKHNIDLSNVNV